jgi:hypothetical protein
MTMFETERQKFFGTKTRQEERSIGPEAPKYWHPKLG